MNKKKCIIGFFLVLVLILVWIAWKQLGSTTKIALLNFQQFQTTSIIQSNEDGFVKYNVLSLDKLDKASRYDFVLAFGMGMNISNEQRELLQATMDKGVPVLVYGATNPENNLCNLDSIQQSVVSAYLRNGNKRNYRNMARYIRQQIDNKTLFVTPADSVVESASDVLYHLDEELSFATVADYEAYLKQNGFYSAGGAKIAIVGGLNDPFSGNRENMNQMMRSFQKRGMNVYPVFSLLKRLDFLEQIQPDAVVYFAHGRLAMGKADAAVEWLKERNIPIFAPLTILQTEEEWQNDPMGMFGGFMSQSVIMPELDGVIYPYVVNAQEVNKEGLYLFKAIPDRLRNFTEIVSNFITLQRKKNEEKKVAIYYFKGPGKETLTAQGLETVPSLYNLLKRMKAEGYKVDGLPATEQDFEELLMTQGAVLNTYAEGAFEEYLATGNPALIEKSEYESWIKKSISPEIYTTVVNAYGEAPGNYMSVRKDNSDYLAVARIVLGNVALLPQPMAALGDDAFAIVHGAKQAPPHTYIGAYLWSQYAFKADALLHFGTHGSLEFTPQKQVALSSNDWPDRLVGALPHFYYYTIGNIGESMMAKRRSYATVVSYLTPPFMESEMRSQFRSLLNKIQDYYKTDGALQEKFSLEVKKIAVAMGLHRDLRLDSLLVSPYSTEEIERIENFAEEIANEKMTGQLYVTGVPYEQEKIHSSVMAMSADPIAYSLATLDKLKGKVTQNQLKSSSFFSQHYLEPAKKLVNQVLNGREVDSAFICNVSHVTLHDLAEAKRVLTPPQRGMMAMMESLPKDKTKELSKGGHPSWIPKMGHKEKPDTSRKTEPSKPTGMAKVSERPQLAVYTKEQKERARAILEVERTLNNIINYKKALKESPEMELQALMNALNGGYVAPSSGGDAIANPTATPTGKNLYSINAESTPSEIAWDKGVALVDATLEQYQKQHGKYPQKVSYTFWSSEFIESEGATIAQALYMLGVQPVRDAFGRVSDIELISSELLGRPRIDVVIQTSGQFRDLAASRLDLISRAVDMAALASAEEYENYVSLSTTEIERQLVDQGIPPKDARELSTQRVFGGVNGSYGTGIQEMVKSGDQWEEGREIADTYINNMGAVYGNNKNWGQYNVGLLRAVLHHTDVVVQPRQSNTWGALSLDHVFEFMGGLNLAVREVTGKDPEAYFADYRNHNHVKMQDLKEAIGVESRSTVFNPAYIKEVMKGKASSAAQITEVVTNSYAWNVMKPNVIDNEMWDEFYEVYIKDSYDLGVQQFFKKQNPMALQEITAVMMETARKGMWKATNQQLNHLAQLHTDLVKEFGASGSGFAGSNIKLQDFIAQKTTEVQAVEYKQQLEKMKNGGVVNLEEQNGTVLKKQEVVQQENGEKNSLSAFWVISIVLVCFIGLLVLLRYKRKQQ